MIWRILDAAETAIARQAHPKPLNGLSEGYPGPTANMTGYRVARGLHRRGARVVVRAEVNGDKRKLGLKVTRRYPVIFAKDPEVPPVPDLDSDAPPREVWYLVYEEAARRD